MKHLGGILFAAAMLSAVATMPAAALSGIDVTVKNEGKTVARAKTDAAGKFATADLGAGSYNVEFRAPKGSDLKGQNLSISLAAGKDERRAEAKGEHLPAGVALNMELPKTGKLSGQIRAGQGTVARANETGPAGMEKVKANVKVINGKRHVWVPGPIGSNMGGRWAEEGSDAAALSTSNKKAGDGEVLRRIQDQSGNIGNRPDG